MMKKTFIIIFFVLSMLTASGGFFGNAYDYGTNARSIALSKALVANYNRGNNVFSNPAYLGYVINKEYSFSHFSLSLDRFMHTISISLPMPDEEAGIGISAFITGVEEIPMTVDQPDDFLDMGYYNTYEGYLMCSFGAKLTKKISLGINLRFLKNEISKDYSASGLGSDIGMLIDLSKDYKMGLAINNLYSKYSWDFNYGGTNYEYDEKFYRTFILGLSANIYDNILFLSQIEYISNVKRLNYRIGFEKNIFIGNSSPIKIRSGVNYKNDLFSPSCGLGYTVDSYQKFNIDIDYAFDNRTIGNGFNHLFTLTFYKK